MKLIKILGVIAGFLFGILFLMLACGRIIHPVQGLEFTVVQEGRKDSIKKRLIIEMDSIFKYIETKKDTLYKVPIVSYEQELKNQELYKELQRAEYNEDKLDRKIRRKRKKK